MTPSLRRSVVRRRSMRWDCDGSRAWLAIGAKRVMAWWRVMVPFAMRAAWADRAQTRVVWDRRRARVWMVSS